MGQLVKSMFISEVFGRGGPVRSEFWFLLHHRLGVTPPASDRRQGLTDSSRGNTVVTEAQFKPSLKF